MTEPTLPPEVEKPQTEAVYKPSPEEARRLFAQTIQEFARQGQLIIGPRDFKDWCDRYRISRPWVSARLKEAAAQGFLQPAGAAGRWRITSAPSQA